MKYFDPAVSAIRLAVETVRTGKLTSAARKLHMSQSGASHALQTLEQQTGKTIFVRQRDGLRLSQVGQRLLPHFENLLSNLDALQAEISDLDTLRSGTLRVAAVPSLLASILPPLLREYSTQFPGVDLSIFEGTDDEVRSWVVDGLAHVGFAALPVEGVAAEEIARDEWLALIPEQHAGNASTISLKQLTKRKFLLSGGGCETHILRLFAERNIAIGERFLIKQLSTIQAMVAQDLGVSLVPSLSVKSVQDCRAIPLRPRAFRRIGMFSASAAAASPALTAWRKLVISHCLAKT